MIKSGDICRLIYLGIDRVAGKKNACKQTFFKYSDWISNFDLFSNMPLNFSKVPWPPLWFRGRDVRGILDDNYLFSGGVKRLCWSAQSSIKRELSSWRYGESKARFPPFTIKDLSEEISAIIATWQPVST